MRIPAAAVKPLVVLAVAAVSFGCITPAYAQDATATVTSDGSNHIVVDINLHDDTDSSGSDSKSDSSSTDENDSETTGEAKNKKEDELKGKWWEKACGDIPASSFLIVLGFAVLAAIIGGIIGFLAEGNIGIILLFGSIGFTIVLLLGEMICVYL